MSSWSEAPCPHCHKTISYSMLKKASMKKGFIPEPPKLSCPACGGKVRNSMHKSGWLLLGFVIIFGSQFLQVSGTKVPMYVYGIGFVIGLIGFFQAAKTNKLIKDE